jgi:hydroxyethylthiazole kinase-like uncharacterized protein yjeF
MIGPGAVPPRLHDGHKRDFGRIGVIGGCQTSTQHMLGAPVLAGRAALRAGSGGVVLLMTQSLLQEALVVLPEATGLPLPQRNGEVDSAEACSLVDGLDVDAVVVGPGLGVSPFAMHLVAHVLRTPGPPAVIDADGLNALASCSDDPPVPSRSIVLTPHLGEYATLAKRFVLPDVSNDQSARRAAATALAKRFNAIVVLKGFGTVVAEPSGSTWVCEAGCNTLAVPGSGDVLSGLIGSLIGAQQRLGNSDDASAVRLAVQVHAKAGDRYAATVSRRGLLARELADQLSSILDEEAST